MKYFFKVNSGMALNKIVPSILKILIYAISEFTVKKYLK